jgi:hypothetical protein
MAATKTQLQSVGILRVDADSSDLDLDAQPHVHVYECPWCFSLVREPSLEGHMARCRSADTSR